MAYILIALSKKIFLGNFYQNVTETGTKFKPKVAKVEKYIGDLNGICFLSLRIHSICGNIVVQVVFVK